jgi:hypothetical protein
VTIDALLSKVKSNPEIVEFDDVMATIADHFDYTPSRFRNGELVNEAGTNEGSCKVFAFAQLQGLSEQETLSLFGRYYREDVLGNPTGSDHGNIRNFMQTGWSGIAFDQVPLKPKGV